MRMPARRQSPARTRRDFLHIATGAVGTVGAAAAFWPLIDQMNPAADMLSLAQIEVDLSSIAKGQAIKVLWRGKPVFIRRRTEAEIAQANEVIVSELPDPEPDSDRVRRPEWLILVGVCTHFGCVPLSHRGDYGGWFCPCHWSHYDTSGRIRKGPAPRNLDVPEYRFLEGDRVLIG